MTLKRGCWQNLATQHAVVLIFARRMKGRMLFDRSAKLWTEFDEPVGQRIVLGRFAISFQHCL